MPIDQEQILEVVADALSNRFYGKYRGRVVSNKDPEGRGRLQVVIPEILGENTPRWALPASPFAGNGVGFFALPPEQANVWCEFEAGLLRHVIWSGCFWSEGELPESDAVPERFFLRTGTASILIDDKKGTITVETTDGAKITMGDSGKILMEGNRVTSKAQGKSTELSASAFDANRGALKVM